MTDQELEQGIGSIFRQYMKTREDYFLYKHVMRDAASELKRMGNSIEDHPEKMFTEWINREAFATVVKLSDHCEGNLMKAIEETSRKIHDLKEKMTFLYKTLRSMGYAVILKDMEE